MGLFWKKIKSKTCLKCFLPEPEKKIKTGPKTQKRFSYPNLWQKLGKEYPEIRKKCHPGKNNTRKKCCMEKMSPGKKCKLEKMSEGRNVFGKKCH